jgi:hypothetical protein
LQFDGVRVPRLDPDPRTSDEREMLLGFLRRQRETVLKTAEGLTDEQVRWTPPGRLTPIIAILNHLPYVEWRWVDGRYLGEEVSRSELEFQVPADRTIEQVIADYQTRASRTEAIVRAAPSVEVECPGHPSQPPRPGLNLRWVLLHLIEETAHHAGHADATREMLDGSRLW